MITEQMKAIPFFSSFSPSQIQEIILSNHYVCYPKKAILCYECDTLKSVYFLLHGRIRVYKINRFGQEIFLYHIRQNGLITGLFKNISYGNIEFVEDSNVLIIPQESFWNLVRKYSLSSPLLQLHQDYIMRLESIIDQEIIFDGLAKVSHFLDQHLDEFNALKKQEIAACLNIQPETLSRILKKLHRDNIITTDSRGNIEIIQQIKLRNNYRTEEK
ncbi:hypothetical protein CCZ01_03500 [Helicobacter monodelphidis]|uniref:Crp/Fnr family transcriptional regulator n=1 Tax=Helicobacter sp. 15-1451 TaxID=2004995 RepID=UPI000DCC3DD0|nr:Crp/Fnr family transcriptional regulator [Helicobacter sp. 15-1451]RAX58151.1 hypothetical protein CCZ01_03500 [Helicobacter sp. 15-1451]